MYLKNFRCTAARSTPAFTSRENCVFAVMLQVIKRTTMQNLFITPPIRGEISIWKKRGKQLMIRNVRDLRKTPHFLSRKYESDEQTSLFIADKYFNALHEKH